MKATRSISDWTLISAYLDNELRAREKDKFEQKLRANPTDEALKHSVRTLDLQARRTYFRHLNLNLVGAWLLVVGAGLFVLSARKVRAAEETAHLPKAQIGEATHQARAAKVGRWAIAGSGAGTITEGGLAELTIQLEAPPLEVKDLDALPMPARDALLCPESFSSEDMGLMITSRGCPYQCSYCSNCWRQF
jgi:hypothetical protein